MTVFCFNEEFWQSFVSLYVCFILLNVLNEEKIEIEGCVVLA